MKKPNNLFVSCVESRVQDDGSMYARFHLGTFFRGQGLTFANALRRTLLSEMPGLVIADVEIEGASHEFALLPGIEETVLEILLNLKKVTFIPSISQFVDLSDFKATGFLKSRGPAKVIAADLKLPENIRCVSPNTHIATLTSGSELAFRFHFQVHPFSQSIKNEKFDGINGDFYPPQEPSLSQNFSNIEKAKTTGNDASFKEQNPLKTKKRKLLLDTVPTPIERVNYAIRSLNAKQASEYVVLEVWTNGSIRPHESVQFGLKSLTNLFFQFTALSKQKTFNL
nr:RNA polymerase alpha subunit [Chlorella variabilis]